MSKTEVVVKAIAQYLGCAESVPWERWQVERRLAALEAKEKVESKSPFTPSSANILELK